MSLVNTYSVQDESAMLFWEGILRNPLHRSIPDGIEDAGRNISFTGSRLPFVPVNWRFAESISSLKALEASLLSVLIHKKYGLPYQKITIDTDHAHLFLMSPAHPMCVIDPEGEKILSSFIGGKRLKYKKYFLNRDIHQPMEPTMPEIDCAMTNIYRLGDRQYYHVHASMNPNPSQTAVGIDRSQFLHLSNVGSRPNGTDAPRWPKDLMTEIVS